jgi:hypothetical protein
MSSSGRLFPAVLRAMREILNAFVSGHRLATGGCIQIWRDWFRLFGMQLRGMAFDTFFPHAACWMDELAVDFGHTAAGEALRAGREVSKRMAEAGEAAKVRLR